MATSTITPKSPRELYRISKRQGTWDPEDIPVAEDRAEWQSLTRGQQEQLRKICSLFYEGEVSVSDTLAWLIVGMAEPDRRAFLVIQAFEEVKHAEFFDLYFREVMGKVDTSTYLIADYKGVLLDELRDRGEAVGQAVLNGDPATLEREVVLFMAHYMGIIEGTMAVSGYEYFEEMVGKRGILKRLLEGIRLIRADEGRHLTHGMDYLRQKLAEKPAYVAPVQQIFFEELQKLPARTDFVFEPNDFNLDRERMMALGMECNRQRLREIGLG